MISDKSLGRKSRDVLRCFAPVLQFICLLHIQPQNFWMRPYFVKLRLHFPEYFALTKVFKMASSICFLLLHLMDLEVLFLSSIENFYILRLGSQDPGSKGLSIWPLLLNKYNSGLAADCSDGTSGSHLPKS